MEFEDSRFALFPEPNANIQIFEKRETKKIVFQEPYECLPNYYVNNDFVKHNCNCVANPIGCECDKVNKHNKNNCSCNDNFSKPKTSFNCGQNHCNDNEKGIHENLSKPSLGFDLKSLIPLLGLFNKGSNTDISQIARLLNNGDYSKDNSNFNPISLISSIFSNNDMMGGILNLFKGGLFSKKQNLKKEPKTTDYQIRNYTKV